MPSRSEPILVLELHDADDAARCLRALSRAELPDGITVFAGGAPNGREIVTALGGFLQATWVDAHGAALVNEAAAAEPVADLLFLDGASEGGPRWCAGMQYVAAAEPDAATVTALSNDAAFLSVPRRNLPWPLPPSGLTPDQASEAVAAGSGQVHPRIPTALPHAVLIRRAALQLVGALDETLDLDQALADWCARASGAGLVHVLADEVFVAHRGAAPSSATDCWTGEAAERHPALSSAVVEAAHDRYSALSRALLTAAVSLEPLSVSVDARCLTGGMSGTTVHVVELLGALSARDDVRVRALLPERIPGDIARALERLSDVERISGVTEELPRTHVAHRPWQVEEVADVAVLDRLGERTVVTHQDLIGFRTPGVFPSVQRWEEYRRTTRDALGLAAMVVFFSAAAAHDAVVEDLVVPERARVVPIGALPRVLAGQDPMRPPSGMDAGSSRPFLALLGNRFRHKNVGFALELLAALRERHGWDGDLVLAGAETLHGSSSGQDAEWLLRHPQHAEAVRDVGTVTEAEKSWLLAHAAAVLYPSTYEGFGLVPFEAAAAGTPSLLASVSALAETVPHELASLVPWDARASAARVIGVLTDGPARTGLVEGLRAAAAELTWDAAAKGVVAAYHAALRLPAPAAARVAADLARAEHDYWSVRDGIPEPVWALVRPDAPLIDVPLAKNLAAALRRGRGRTVRAAARLAGRGARPADY